MNKAINRRTSLAERSGKPYPHNAITEILSKGSPAESIRLPIRFSKKTINKFWEMLERSPERVRRAYTIVFANGNSLTEAARILKVSPTTVRRWLDNIYYVKDDCGYLVANLYKCSKAAPVDLKYVDGEPTIESIEKWNRWITRFAEKHNPNLTRDMMINILDDLTRGVGYEVIADYYMLNRDDVKEFAKQVKEWGM